MKILLAGGTGVLGRRVVPLLVGKGGGHGVTGVARTPEKATLLTTLGATPVALDLFDEGAVRRAAAGCDVVINLATHIPSASKAFLPGAWRENERINRLGAANLAEAVLAAGSGGKFIQQSFAPIYVSAGDQWIDEHAPVQPASYNKAVLDAEAAADRITREGGTGIVLRFAYFYGPDSDHTLDLIKSVRRGWALTLGPADAFVPAISLDDAATAVVAALGIAAGVYNVADNEPVPRREFVDALARALAVKPPRLLPSWMSYVAGSIGESLARSQRISNDKLRGASGWAPQYPSVREGWRALVAADMIQV